MGRRTVAQFARQIKRVLSPTRLNDLGRQVGFCHRERLVTPYRLVLGLLASHATGRVETLADIQRQFNALFGTTVSYKPFHNQLAKRSFKDFMRAVLEVVLQQWVVGVLQPKARGPLGAFGRIVIQDGCSFAVKDSLREHYPGRFRKQNPAAVELHVTMNLLEESVEQVTLTADTAPERPHSPPPERLRDDLLLADRGYLDPLLSHKVRRKEGPERTRDGMIESPQTNQITGDPGPWRTIILYLNRPGNPGDYTR